MFHGNQYWSADEQQPSASWTRLQDKLFEDALVVFPDNTPDRWEKIAGQVPGKSPWVVRQHYEDLVHDVAEIDSGRVELPRYENEGDSRGWDFESGTSQASFGTKMKQSETERRKGVPWTEEEHRLFLIGLERYGKGDWRSISRNAVVSRTPTQVASHAQKYFLRVNSIKKEKKRSSIHDITNVGPSSVGQTNDQNWTTPMATLVRQPMDPRSSLEPFSDQGIPLGYRGFRFPM